MRAETEMVGGESTLVMEEREWVDDEVAEVSRNFLNQCPNTQDVFSWGEVQNPTSSRQDAPVTTQAALTAVANYRESGLVR